MRSQNSEGGNSNHLTKDEGEDGWLTVSMEGFSQQNRARPFEHLVKELVQNSLDAIGDAPGTITVSVEEKAGGEFTIECLDDGEGVDDMTNLRTVFWTSKHDSRFKRGRMGRGFKELLCLCSECHVFSRNLMGDFTVKDGRKAFFLRETAKFTKGTLVRMKMPWRGEGVGVKLADYFKLFLPPQNVRLEVCGIKIPSREPTFVTTGSLPTEEFENNKWCRPRGKTGVELVKHKATETSLVYEMGIPICPVEWNVPYHVNVLQRVPMNPNRDAVMSGYVSQIHRICLPVLIEELSSEKSRESWVGEAAARSGDDGLQKAVLQKAFGGNLARSVPNFGKFSHDADAQEHAGVSILDTKQLTGGFREMARKHVPTSAEIAKQVKSDKLKVAVKEGVDLSETSLRYKKLLEKRGEDRIIRVGSFYQWVANGILQILFPEKTPKCKIKVADFKGEAEATWSNQFQHFTLALDLDRIWDDPSHPDNFALIVHETAHELAAHHGQSFAWAMETTAGAGCHFLFKNKDEIGRWDF
jgi:hypothetical protein